jgi:hypothetical protein
MGIVTVVPVVTACLDSFRTFLLAPTGHSMLHYVHCEAVRDIFARTAKTEPLSTFSTVSVSKSCNSL